MLTENAVAKIEALLDEWPGSLTEWAIRALLADRRELLERIKNRDALLVCFRTRTRPSEKPLDKLAKEST